MYFFLQGLINLKNYDDRLYVNIDDLAVWASDFSNRKGWSNEHCSAMKSSSIYPYFLLIKQLFKTSCLTTKQGEVQLSYILTYFYTFSLGKTNDFVLTSLKAATLISPPPPNVFYTKHVSYFKMSNESTQKIFQCCICGPFCCILKSRCKNSFID